MPLNLHLVSHTHWDREWYQPFQVFRVRLVRLIDRLLDLLSRDSHYRHFMLDGQTVLLEDYVEIRPERADEITRFIRAGRLAIGPWYVLPDEFLVSPEALVRNLLLGDQLCRRFGGKMNVGYLPDPFGHIGQMPQMLRGFGIQVAAFRRGLDDQPVELWWQAPDGSRVRVAYLRDGYDNAARLPTDPDAFVAAIRAARDSLVPYAPSGHLLLLAGTDHQEAQPELSALIAYANDGRLDGDRLIHSSLSAYTQALMTTDPAFTVHGELRSPRRHHLLPGVLSTRMWIKQRNDAVETLLTRWAEPFIAWAELLPATTDPHTHLTGHEPMASLSRPAPFLRHAWRLLLQNHPHDSICGCSVDQVHREMASRFDQAEQIAETFIAQGLGRIADQIDTAAGDGQPLVVFNPTGGPRTDVVVTQVALPPTVQVIAPDGHTVPHQIAADPARPPRDFFRVELTPADLLAQLALIQGGRLLNHTLRHIHLHRDGDTAHLAILLSEHGQPDHDHLNAVRTQIQDLIATGDVARFIATAVVVETRQLTFVAPDLPPYGYATFTVRPAPATDASPLPAVDPHTAETDLLTIQVDPADGTLTLTDKRSGAVYPGLNRFVDGGDRGDEYNHCPPENDRLVTEPAAPPTVERIENGPARYTLQVTQTYHLPRALTPDRRGRAAETVPVTLISRISLSPGLPRLDIETVVDNTARDHRLRVHFPIPVQTDHAHTEAHYHVARRPVPPLPPSLDTNGWVEQPVPTVPQRGWADVSDGRVGLMVANRGLPEVEFIPGDGHTTLALTLLRSVGWLSRDDLPCRQGHAGPALPTPEAQCPGRHTFHYALIPHTGGWEAARAHADAFRAPPRAIAANGHGGFLPPVASLVRAEPDAFVITAIKQPEQNDGLIVRGVNLSDTPTEVRLYPLSVTDGSGQKWRPMRQAARVDLKEELVEPLVTDDKGAVTLTARPWEIVTVRWRGW